MVHLGKGLTPDQYARDKATLKLAVKAALGGGAKSKLTYVAGWVPACDEPVKVYRYVKSGREIPAVEVEFLVPCRRCKRCLQIRQMKWRSRALHEIEKAKRTWMVTLTFSPLHLAGVIAEASALKRGSAVKRVETAAYAHVQKYLKRLRKASGTMFRYLAVYERGEETGRSHYHLLIHETGNRPLLKATIESQWRSFVHARLVADKARGAASYVTKYATKNLDVAPRASLRYGHKEIERE